MWVTSKPHLVFSSLGTCVCLGCAKKRVWFPSFLGVALFFVLSVVSYFVCDIVGSSLCLSYGNRQGVYLSVHVFVCELYVHDSVSLMTLEPVCGGLRRIERFDELQTYCSHICAQPQQGCLCALPLMKTSCSQTKVSRKSRVVASLPNQSSKPNQRKMACGKMKLMILQSLPWHNQVLIFRKLSGSGAFIIWATDLQISEEPCDICDVKLWLFMSSDVICLWVFYFVGLVEVVVEKYQIPVPRTEVTFLPHTNIWHVSFY